MLCTCKMETAHTGETSSYIIKMFVLRIIVLKIGILELVFILPGPFLQIIYVEEDVKPACVVSVLQVRT